MVHFNPIDNNGAILGGKNTRLPDPVAEMPKIDFNLKTLGLNNFTKGLEVEHKGISPDARIEINSVRGYNLIKDTMPKPYEELLDDKTFLDFASNYGFNPKYVTPATALHAAFNPYFA